LKRNRLSESSRRKPVKAAGRKAGTRQPRSRSPAGVPADQTESHPADPREGNQQHGEDRPQLYADGIRIRGCFLLDVLPEIEDLPDYKKVSGGTDGQVLGDAFHRPEQKGIGRAKAVAGNGEGGSPVRAGSDGELGISRGILALSPKAGSSEEQRK
jgi:hypothetical protein